MQVIHYPIKQADIWAVFNNENELIELSFQKINNAKEASNEDVFYQQLKDYFNCKLKKFDIDYKLNGTPFQVSVWNALLNVEYGTTRSYSDIAQAINKPKAVRAVANAIGQNPLSILVPCHRIIRKSGAIGGYSGGLDKKRLLMEIENIE